MTTSLLSPLNFLDLMTITGSIAPAAGFEYTNTQNPLRSSVWQSLTAADQDVLFALATGSVTADCVGFFRHHCHGGLVRITGYPNNNGTGTPLFQVNASPGAIFTAITTGYDWGYTPYTGLDTHDPLGLESPFFATFTRVAGIKSVRFEFSSKSTTYGFAYWEVGRFWLGNSLPVVYVPFDGFGIGRGESTESDRTIGGSYLAAIGARWPIIKFDVNNLTEAEIATHLDVMDANQTARDVVISFYNGAGGRKERDAIINGPLSGLDILGRKVTGGFKALQIAGN